jgi:hypothetical protein
MYSEDCIIEELVNMFDNIKVLDEINDNIITARFNTLDDAYDALLDGEDPSIYSFNRVNDGSSIWYKLRYTER